jgi:pyrroloquinoline quinone (PQQ) biosynthesis protein C
MYSLLLGAVTFVCSASFALRIWNELLETTENRVSIQQQFSNSTFAAFLQLPACYSRTRCCLVLIVAVSL